jgi:AraC-like DNA-binding protein
MCSAGLSRPMNPETFLWMTVFLVLIYVLLFLAGVWFRVREVRAVMQAGTVWAGVSFATETVYVVIVLTEVTALMLVAFRSELAACASSLLLAGAMTAYGLRIACDSLFVLMKRHERRIVESMKISPVEVSGMEPDDIYKDIYERVLEYFDRDKPFLNGDLTINDVVSVVFTNKLYISRAISQHTGRNFCQFVNYHRVMYSVECFRRNPDLKVTELWSMCGFNTIVSYNMAFKLFMGENPSDWCRKEKVRIFRRPK